MKEKCGVALSIRPVLAAALFPRPRRKPTRAEFLDESEQAYQDAMIEETWADE